MISVEGLCKTYAPKHKQDHFVHALKNLHFQVSPGEIFGIIGKLGSGKSVLARCLNLWERPSQGQVLLGTDNLAQLPSQLQRIAQRKLALIQSNPLLLSSRNVYGNIALPLECVGFEKQEIEGILLPILDRVGLTEKIKAYPHQLSPGQQHRVAIARALVHQPKVLCCDEVTRQLDISTALPLLRLLRQINQEMGLTLIVLTQDMDVIKSICDRAAMLDQGQIVEEERVTHLFTHPKSDLAKELIRINTRSEMPQTLRRKMMPRPSDGCHYVLRLSFTGQAAQEPLIAQVIQRFEVIINIVQAHMETIREETIGIMIIEMIADDEEAIPKAIDFLNAKNSHIEVLGYVPRTA